MFLNTSFLESTDPFENASAEEKLFRERPFLEEGRLLFYTNRECVQCGRNQDPAAECALEWCQEEQIPVLQRFSGGGTVFHDPGNQNYAFILPRKHYAPEAILILVVKALNAAGVTDARFCSRFSVWHGDKKISGSAFALSGPAALLHGCVLFNTDLPRLTRALTPPESGAASAGNARSRFVASVVSPVANVNDIVPEPELARSRFCRALSELAAEWFEHLPS